MEGLVRRERYLGRLESGRGLKDVVKVVTGMRRAGKSTLLKMYMDDLRNDGVSDGDIVYIRQQETVENGQIAAVLIDGEATLKRVRFYGDHVSLEPENPMYKPLTFWGEEMNQVHILGRAVYFTSAVR